MVLEPIGGGGEFDIRSGLYFDAHLEEEVGNRPIGENDRTFIGIELIGITNPNMVVTISKLWVTEKDDPDKSCKYLSFVNFEI